VVATGTFLPDLQNNIEFIRMIHQEGVNAVVLITSILAEPAESEESLKSRILNIMAQTEKIPLGTYECPVPYKRLLSPELMGGLSETGRFYYHKDTSCDPALIKNKLDKIRGSNFQLYNADTPTALNSLRDGAMGLSPIAGNFYPELVTYLIRLFESGNLQTLKTLNSRLTVMDRVVHDFYPLSAKVFLNKRGLKIGIDTRIPVPELTPQYKNTLEALLHFFEQMMDEYGLETVI
jgi:4-hydroxy-tetrahydrodipicolinate synthase